MIADSDIVRFTQAIERLTAGEGRIGLAVSGGPDSLALLLLAHTVFPNRIAAATVDHGLRPEATDEAHFVAAVCAERGIAHDILTPATPITGNIQSSAREARYALLEKWADTCGLQWITTAHHSDDQLETLLMRLARGSGVAGLAAIRARNGRIIRPLLGFSKAELETICASEGVEPVRDPSNDDSDFDRVAMRQWLAGSAHPFKLDRVARSAAALGDSAEALDWMTAKLTEQHIEQKGEIINLDTTDLPRELARRLLLTALAMVDPQSAPRGDAVDRALDGLPRGEVMTLGNVRCVGGAIWQFEAAPPRRNV